MLSYSSKRFDQFLLKVPLLESREDLVDFSAKKVPGLMFREIGRGKIINPILRKSVAKALFLAAKEFYGLGYFLVLKDAYRSLAAQKKLFLDYLKIIQGENPKLTLIQARQKANIYIAGVPILAAHTCGAAIDVILFDIKNNKKVDMGGKFLDLGSKSNTSNPDITNKQKQNRKLLQTTLLRYGFINYPFEYWHYSVGDVCAAFLTKQKAAKYGPVDYESKEKKTFFPKNQKFFFEYFR